MRKIIAKKWVKALRSGKYKQGKGYLKQFNSKNEPRHCCLGVLCELYDQQMKKNHKKTLRGEYMVSIEDIEFIRFNKHDGGLREWADITNPLAEFEIDDARSECLADLNDSGKKFSTIADIIEKNVENI
ncbi:MAG: hypothetical protein EBZ62_08985 [Sphingobacteriia bacterium]|nr:hypothetical protein [Sphingobacteriia bacterium]